MSSWCRSLGFLGMAPLLGGRSLPGGVYTGRLTVSRTVYTAANEADALAALDAFDATWGRSYPSITNSWRANWTRISPFFALPAELRRAVYTTNPIEALNRQLRKITKTRGAFPTDASVMKLLWLAVDRAAKKWQMPIHNWGMVRQQLAIVFGDRFPTD